MIPDYVYTVIIGEEYPDIVKYCMDHNKSLCESHNVNYRILQVERDPDFPYAGLQADYQKLLLQLTTGRVMCIDWDIQLLSFPDISESDYPYFARTSNKNDLFLSYTTTENSKNIIRKMFKEFTNVKKYTSGMSGFRVVNNYFDETIEYTGEYVHYRTQCGYPSIQHTYEKEPEDKKVFINGKCKYNNMKAGKIWPVYL